MSNTNISAPAIADVDLVISRVFDAPRELVFKAWSEAESLAKWWGPKGMKIGISQFDFTPGGTFLYSMETPDGNSMWGKFIYEEIAPPERLVFVTSFSDPDANITRAPFAENFPLQTRSTLVFTEQDGKTLLEMRGTPINATNEEVEFFKGMNSSMQGGWKGTLDALDAFLAE